MAGGIVVAWSSRTGNTRRVAEAVASALPGAELLPADEVDAVPGDCAFFCGFWVDKGEVSEDALRLLRRTRGVPVFLFGTMGGNPGDERSRAYLAKKLAGLRGEGIRIASLRMFQGKIDPAVVERMNRTRPMTEESRARLEEAARHPDEADFEETRAWARECLEGMKDNRSA